MTWVKRSGRVGWTAPLPGARPGGAVEIAGAGRRLAIGYEAEEGGRRGPVVVTATREGALAPLWRGEGDAGAPPALAWSKGVLAIAVARGGEAVTEVVALPGRAGDL